MTSLIFFIVILTLIVLAARISIRLIKHKSPTRDLIAMGLIIGGYSLAWSLFKLTQRFVPTPRGAQICFDDWCATVSKSERQLSGDSTVIILHIEMFNNARGIAQKPSEPRVHILDLGGRVWPYSSKWQQGYEIQYGPQPGIEHRLELHQSMETALVFCVPNSATGLKALIEEGPLIADFLFPEDKQVFLIQ